MKVCFRILVNYQSQFNVLTQMKTLGNLSCFCHAFTHEAGATEIFIYSNQGITIYKNSYYYGTYYQLFYDGLFLITLSIYQASAILSLRKLQQGSINPTQGNLSNYSEHLIDPKRLTNQMHYYFVYHCCSSPTMKLQSCIITQSLMNNHIVFSQLHST